MRPILGIIRLTPRAWFLMELCRAERQWIRRVESDSYLALVQDVGVLQKKAEEEMAKAEERINKELEKAEERTAAAEAKAAQMERELAKANARVLEAQRG